MDLVAIVPRIPPPIVTLMRRLISTSLQCDGMGDSTILAASDRSLGAVRRPRLFGPLPGTYRLATRHRPRRTRVRPRSNGWVSRRGGDCQPRSLPTVRRSTVRSARATLRSSSLPSARMRSFFRRETSAVMSSPSRTTWRSARAPLLRRAAVRLFSQPRLRATHIGRATRLGSDPAASRARVEPRCSATQMLSLSCALALGAHGHRRGRGQQWGSFRQGTLAATDAAARKGRSSSYSSLAVSRRACGNSPQAPAPLTTNSMPLALASFAAL